MAIHTPGQSVLCLLWGLVVKKGVKSIAYRCRLSPSVRDEEIRYFIKKTLPVEVWRCVCCFRGETQNKNRYCTGALIRVVEESVVERTLWYEQHEKNKFLKWKMNIEYWILVSVCLSRAPAWVVNNAVNRSIDRSINQSINQSTINQSNANPCEN